MDAERTTWRKPERQRGRRELVLEQRMNSHIMRHVIAAMAKGWLIERERERERETLPARAQCCLVCCSIQKQQRRFRCEVTRQLHFNTRKGLRHKNTRSRDRETEACPLSRTNNRHLLSQNIVSSVKSPPCPHPPPLRDGTGNTETSRHRRVLEVDFEQRE